MADESKRYYYIVWRRVDNNIYVNHEVTDMHPADWVARDMELLKNSKEGLRLLAEAAIINQFEISAEQYQALEAIQ